MFYLLLLVLIVLFSFQDLNAGKVTKAAGKAGKKK